MTESHKKARRKVPRCPACGAPRQHDYRPFCSARCRDRDLAKWIDGDYAIPVVEEEEDRDGIGEREGDYR